LICSGHAKIDIFREEGRAFNCRPRLWELKFRVKRAQMLGERGDIEIVMSLDV
jgi:hypothetical protein